MNIKDKDEILDKIENMSKEEVKAIIVKACEGTGLTLEDFISINWNDFFTNYKKPDFTNHTGNAIDYPN